MMERFDRQARKEIYEKNRELREQAAKVIDQAGQAVERAKDVRRIAAASRRRFVAQLGDRKAA
jgi:hypothetical protein